MDDNFFCSGEMLYIWFAIRLCGLCEFDFYGNYLNIPSLIGHISQEMKNAPDVIIITSYLKVQIVPSTTTKTGLSLSVGL